MRYEILSGGVVVNTVLADAEFMAANYAAGSYRSVADLAPPAEATLYLIDIGPFFDRFGAAKMAVLTSADAGVKAILADLQVRKWIDLKRADVGQGVAYVASKVPAVTAALQTAILTTPVAAEENLALRKLYFGG